jgi:hypothetical protein
MIRTEYQAHAALCARPDTMRVGRTFHMPAPKRRKPSLVRWLLNLIGA